MWDCHAMPTLWSPTSLCSGGQKTIITFVRDGWAQLCCMKNSEESQREQTLVLWFFYAAGKILRSPPAGNSHSCSSRAGKPLIWMGYHSTTKECTTSGKKGLPPNISTAMEDKGENECLWSVLTPCSERSYINCKVIIFTWTIISIAYCTSDEDLLRTLDRHRWIL